MTVPYNYEINVAKKTSVYPNGKHYCKIELGDCSAREAHAKFEELKKLFGDSEFSLTLYKVTCYREVVVD